MSAVQAPVAPAHVRRSGQIEAGLFVLTIALLNLAYAGAHAVGAHPVAFLVYAMLIASCTLLALTGPGPEALRIMLSPLSWVVGFGFIGMETLYYLMLWYVTPAEASVLTRLGIPLSMVMGVVIHGRRPRRRAIWGAMIVVAGVAALCLMLDPASALHGLALASGCALIMNARTFATEFHPWNRRAETVFDKMRVTGLVLFVTSCAGTALVLALMATVRHWCARPEPMAALDRRFPAPAHAAGGLARWRNGADGHAVSVVLLGGKDRHRELHRHDGLHPGCHTDRSASCSRGRCPAAYAHGVARHCRPLPPSWLAC